MEQQIRENYLIKSASQLGRDFGLEDQIVTRFMKQNDLVLPPDIAKTLRSQALKERIDKKRNESAELKAEDEVIRQHYLLMPVKTLGHQIGRTHGYIMRRIAAMGLEIPREIIEQRKIDSQLKKGNVPATKGKKQSEFMSPEALERTKATRFQKGQTPHNAIGYENGDVRIRISTEDRGARPYQWIRLGKSNWQLLQIQVWEAANHRPLPDGHCVWFKDGNSLNCEISNLELITRAENMKRNSIHQYPEEVKTSIRVISKLNKKIRHAEKQVDRPE